MKMKFFGALSILAMLGACAPEGRVEVHSLGNPLISYESKPEAEFSFSDKDLKSLDLAAANAVNLKIKPSALGSLFLWSVAAIDAPPAPTGSALANKVVSFEVRGQKLAMFESLQGKVATSNVATKVLLAQFPIIESTDEWITFDLGAGLDLVYQKRSLQAGEARDSEDTVLTLTHSFIDKVELRDQFIFINQFARATLPAAGKEPSKNVSLHLKHVLQSYVPSSDYTAKKTLGLTKIGFFETDTVISAGSGEEAVYIMRQHPKKKITWYLKGPIPAEHKQAVMDGILYWNQVFGSEKIEVKDLPANVGVHEPGYNIVQWLEWDTAGFAYANIHGDPLTGEVLQGHVYMTSVFGKSGALSAKKYFEQLIKDQRPSNPTDTFGIKGWKSATACEFDLKVGAAKSALIALENIEELSEEEQAKIFLRVANDYVRAVVAHEVGHALGLRHNFAGSLATTLTPANYDEKTLAYFLRDEIDPAEEIVSTVMDYTPLLTSAMTGAKMRKKEAHFIYDHNAIHWGHMDEELPADLPAFCTDGDRSENRYHDCKIWDRFADSLGSAYQDYQDKIRSSAYALATKLAKLEGHESDVREFFTTLALSPSSDAKSFASASYTDIFEALSKDTRFLTVKRLLPVEGELHTELRDSLEMSYLETTLSTLNTGVGGLLLSDLTPNQRGRTPLREKLEEKTYNYSKDVLSKLTSEEMAVVISEMQKYFSRFERELLINFNAQLEKARFKAFDRLDWEDNLKFYAEGLLFNSKDQLLDSAAASIKVKTFNYRNKDHDLRAQIVKAISALHFGATPSNQRARAQSLLLTKKRHQEEMDALTILVDRLGDSAYDYYIWEQERFAPLKSLYR